MKKVFGIVMAVVLTFNCSSIALAATSDMSVSDIKNEQIVPDDVVFDAAESEVKINTGILEKDDDYSKAKLIALHALPMNGYSAEWEIVQETELYDINDSIIGYCFDMINLAPEYDEAPETAYVMVNTNKSSFPLYLFGVDGVSAYFGQSFDRAYYPDIFSFFVAVGDRVIDLRTGETMQKEDFISAFSEELLNVTNDGSSANEDYSSLRADYIAGVMPAASPYTGFVQGVPNLQWQRGCVPTSLAMMILTRYQVLNPDRVINTLADYMGTNSSGSTEYSTIPGAVIRFLTDERLSSPMTNGWNSVDSNGEVITQIRHNPFSVYKASIAGGYPVGVHISSSPTTTPSKPNGFNEDHMMVGVGYSSSSAGDYISCYTTFTKDGTVSFPVTPSGLVNHAWYLLKWTI